MGRRTKIIVYYFNVDNEISARELKLRMNSQGRWYLVQVGEGSNRFWLDYQAAARTFGNPYDTYVFYKTLDESKQIPISEDVQQKISNLLVILEKKSKLPINAQHAIIHAKTYNNIDSFYDLYKFGIAAAGFPNNNPTSGGPAGKNPTIYYYAGEEEKIKNAERITGAKGKKISNGTDSHEMLHINTLSPVPNRKKLKK